MALLLFSSVAAITTCCIHDCQLALGCDHYKCGFEQVQSLAHLKYHGEKE
jgi:hypothetical protein